MHRGQILVTESTGDQIQIKGKAQEPNNLTIMQNGTSLELKYQESTKNDQFEINLPAGILLEIEAFDADINLEGLNSYTNIRNTAGNITLNDTSGENFLWAGRGDIKINRGEGQAVVIGEHGTLTVSQFSGPVSVTTIMGHIQFTGAENNSGDILLEVDHGSVEAQLPDSSRYQIAINSAGGEIVCQGGNLQRTITGCIGYTRDGIGNLSIRSVSGRINFQILP